MESKKVLGFIAGSIVLLVATSCGSAAAPTTAPPASMPELVAATSTPALPAATSDPTPATVAEATPATSTASHDGSKEYLFGWMCDKTGPTQVVGIALCPAMEDYLTLVNSKGGVFEHNFRWQEIEHGYEVPRGIEAYERLKRDGAIFMLVYGTPQAYALTPRATEDQLAIFTPGFGRADAADGQTFPYVFPVAASYWSQAGSIVEFIANKEGGPDNLQGQKIALLYYDNPFGREPIPTYEALADKLGFELKLFAATPPALEQSAQWTDIARRFQADWTITQLAGGSCAVSIKEAARVGFPLEKMVAHVWCGGEQDPKNAGAELAKGYTAAQFAGVGTDHALIQEILTQVYDAGNGHGNREDVGTVYYNRGLLTAAIGVEAFRLAHDEFGDPITGEHIKWGLERVNAKVLEDAGLLGITPPLNLSPEDHEGGGLVQFYQWDGKKYTAISDWIGANRDVVTELVEQSAAEYRSSQQ